MKSLSVSIAHCTGRDFLEAFRADLADATEQVAILSPFLSQNRAIHYYPVLRSLTLRQVLIDVYTKPKPEQPQSLREHFDGVERRLKDAGVGFHMRPGMHEKVGVLDNRILWHGSLNILSHNDTRESMLRFESPELVREVLIDLGLATDAVEGETSEFNQWDRSTSADLEFYENTPGCPQCQQPMLLYSDAGLWICKDSPTCSGTLPLGGTISKSQSAENIRTVQRLELPCPLCKAPLEISQGYLMRVACSSPDCGFALDSRLANSLLRVLRRRVTT
jgi:ribosomal protein L37AE/L43A